MVKMLGLPGMTTVQVDRVSYRVGSDGMFEVEQRHIGALMQHGCRLVNENSADDPDALIPMISLRGSTEVRYANGTQRADAAGVFYIPRKLITEMRAVGLVPKPG